MKRFNDFGVFEKFNKELKALDMQESGFIALHIFRSVIEFELSIKKKIVDDFVDQMMQVDSNKQLQTLDVNVAVNSLKNHLDYVVLLRKIAHYFDLKLNERMTTTESVVGDSARV